MHLAGLWSVRRRLKFAFTFFHPTRAFPVVAASLLSHKRFTQTFATPLNQGVMTREMAKNDPGGALLIALIPFCPNHS